MRRPHPDDVRGAIWTVRCMVRYRLQRSRRQVEEIALPSSAGIGQRGGRAVRSILGHRHDQCLSTALIVQSWRADHGDQVDVVIGVRTDGDGFSAHAWLADAPEAAAGGHDAITRLAPPGRRGGTPASAPGLPAQNEGALRPRP